MSYFSKLLINNFGDSFFNIKKKYYEKNQNYYYALLSAAGISDCAGIRE